MCHWRQYELCLVEHLIRVRGEFVEEPIQDARHVLLDHADGDLGDGASFLVGVAVLQSGAEREGVERDVQCHDPARPRHDQLADLAHLQEVTRAVFSREDQHVERAFFADIVAAVVALQHERGPAFPPCGKNVCVKNIMKS